VDCVGPPCGSSALFFLGLTDEEDALGALELGPVLRGHVVLALLFLEGEERDLLLLGEGFDVVHERLRHLLEAA
jgi:hypothetical protein